MMLSRHCLLAMAAGDGSEAGSGAKLALRQVLAASERHLQPYIQQHLDQIEKLRTQLAESVREVMADALPAKDLDALSEGLQALGRDDMDLAKLSSRLGEAAASGRVDGARLGRLVDVSRGLADLQHHLTEGAFGLGRARAGLTIAPGAVAQWAGAFPYNPFYNPVAIDSTGETAQFARGLLEGQLQQVIAGIRLMRWAQLELDKPREAAELAERLSTLRFEDLTGDERTLCPPMLVIGDGRTLTGRGLAQLAKLLDSGLPVKIVLLNDIGGAVDGGLSVETLGDYPAGQRFDAALLALLGRKAYVAQVSIAHGDHFVDGVTTALAFDGPALIHLHAPSPQKHGFPPQRLHEQAALAARTRAFPIFTFDPNAGGVFGSCLDITANHDADALWVAHEDKRELTPCDWAATEERFAQHFSRMSGDEPGLTPVAEYLQLNNEQREERTPFITVMKDDIERRLRIDDAMINDADERLRLWRTLQELAGLVTPFTKQVREAAERDLKGTHEAEIAKLNAEHETKIAELTAGFETDALQRVTDGLMAFALSGEETVEQPGEVTEG